MVQVLRLQLTDWYADLNVELWKYVCNGRGCGSVREHGG